MTRGSWVQITSAILIIPLLSACSLFGPRLQTIAISTAPEGASIRVNGETAGTSPLRVQVRRSEDVLIEARKEGYETAFRSSHRSMSTLGIVDLIGGAIILLPFVGLLSPAAWEHEPSSYGITLDPKEAPADR